MLADRGIRISHWARSNRAERSASLSRSGWCIAFVVSFAVVLVFAVATAGVAALFAATAATAAARIAAAALFAAAATAVALEHATDAI